MRILAVRGSNLASLTRFAVDFEAEPLAQAGLFAITGPTGAGKSTLLDALCLALYDRTPRLSAKRGAAVGHADTEEEDRIGAYDPRLLLRHGTASGYAEVDFSGTDGGRYRARWSVHRARGRVEGRLQKQSLELLCLDTGKALGGTKTETLEAIESKLGLSFDQFRRSVLLAQGDFAAFLRADRNERADLLERMTGTAIYGRISELAYQRAMEESARIDQLHGAVSSLGVVSDEERLQLEARASEARKKVEDLEARLAVRQGWCRYYDRWHELESAAGAARRDLASAEEEIAQTSALAAELAKVERALPLRELALAVDQEDAKLSAALAARAQRDGEGERMAAALVDTLRSLEAAEAAFASSQGRAAKMQPTLEEARRKETELASLGERASELGRQAHSAREACERTAEHARTLGERKRRIEAEAADIAAWLGCRGGLVVIADEWSRWRVELERHGQAGESQRTAARALDRLEARLAGESPRLQAAAARLVQVEARLREARAAADAARERAAEVDVDAVRIVVDRQRDEHESVRESLRIANRARAAFSEAAAAEAEEREAATALDSLAGERGQMDASRARLEGALLEAEATLARLHLILSEDLRALRQELCDGEPCAVCGSKVHPYRAEGAPGAAVLADQRARTTELKDELRAVDGALSASTERSRSLRAAREAATARRMRALEDLERARQEWAERGRALGELEGLEDPCAEQTLRWLQERDALLGKERQELRAREHEAQRRARERALAETNVEARRSDVEQARLEHQEREREVASLDRELAEARSTRAGAEAHLHELEVALARLRELVADVEGLAATAAVPSVADLDAAVSQLEERRRRAEELERERLAVCAEASVVEADAARRRDELATVDGQWRAARERAEEMRQERLALLGGKTATEVAEALAQAIESDRERVDKARASKAEREQALATARARAEAAREEVERRTQQLRADRERLRKQSEAAGIAADELASLVGRSDVWLEERRKRVTAIHERATATRAVVAERERALAEHLAVERPGVSAADAEAQKSAALSDLEAARAAEVELGAELRRDDRARAARSEVAERIAEQATRVELYATLKELIGSADGRRFRVFAQSLTLEALIAQANQHLGELMNRYRLQRVPGHDLELQVIDRDMGDEVRSVQSLSGGESFLVSLALALGLSSLSARDTRIESLLIDEGFGTLDPDTLDVALSVLDALQASGRKVGLISHVPGMAERVGVRIDVCPRGGGKSDVRVIG